MTDTLEQLHKDTANEVTALEHLKHRAENFGLVTAPIDFEKARQIENDLAECQELMAARVEELPSLLRTSDANDWTV